MEISLNNYKGSSIEKGFSSLPEPNFSDIEKSLEDNFSKGLITEDLFCKAQEELDLIKARGRKVPVGEIRTWNGIKYRKTVSGYERVEEPKKEDLKKADSKADLVKEHKRLVDVLESPSKKDDKKEAKIQKKELEEYESELKTNNKNK
jgi:hypothetical protein